MRPIQFVEIDIAPAAFRSRVDREHREVEIDSARFGMHPSDAVLVAPNGVDHTAYSLERTLASHPVDDEDGSTFLRFACLCCHRPLLNHRL
jgi:hypothetical protein